MAITSPAEKVRKMYEESADSYADMMDSEIDLPVYANTLSRLAERVANLSGPLLDTSCGSGHMLARYREIYDRKRALVGIDLSSRMVAIARSRLGGSTEAMIGDMRDLKAIESGRVAAVLSFFAIHHLGPEEVLLAFKEWYRVLCPAGQLVVASWEGAGPVDYGDEYDVVALRYSKDELFTWTEAAGFAVDRCAVETVAEMPMKAVYLEGTKV